MLLFTNTNGNMVEQGLIHKQSLVVLATDVFYLFAKLFACIAEEMLLPFYTLFTNISACDCTSDH